MGVLEMVFLWVGFGGRMFRWGWEFVGRLLLIGRDFVEGPGLKPLWNWADFVGLKPHA
jgi:hypothetical protein